MNHETGLLSLLKAFATKACFTVGLCTTAYWSVAKIHDAMNPSKPESVQKSEGSNLREKVENLSSQNNLGTVPAIQFNAHPVNRIDRQAAPVVAEASPSPSPETNAAPANGAASGESPSPSPGADAQLQAQQGNPGEYPVAEPIYPNPYAYHQAMMEMAREEAAREVASKSGSSGGTAGAVEPALGQTATGQLITPPKAPVYGGINIATGGGNTVEVKSNLTNQDTLWLNGALVKASVLAQQITVSAHRADGSSNPNATVWSNRWNLSEGVKPEATFVIRPGSGSIPVTFDLTFSIETQNQVSEPVSLSVKPTDSKASNDVTNPKLRIYTFRVPELKVRSGTTKEETVTAVTVHIVLDTTSGAAVFAQGSFSFTRSGIKTDTNPWSASQQTSGAAEQLTVDQLPFSMKLEKQ
jgi:hypothetical protein